MTYKVSDYYKIVFLVFFLIVERRNTGRILSEFSGIFPDCSFKSPCITGPSRPPANKCKAFDASTAPRLSRCLPINSIRAPCDRSRPGKNITSRLSLPKSSRYLMLCSGYCCILRP